MSTDNGSGGGPPPTSSQPFQKTGSGPEGRLNAALPPTSLNRSLSAQEADRSKRRIITKAPSFASSSTGIKSTDPTVISMTKSESISNCARMISRRTSLDRSRPLRELGIQGRYRNFRCCSGPCRAWAASSKGKREAGLKPHRVNSIRGFWVFVPALR